MLTCTLLIPREGKNNNSFLVIAEAQNLWNFCRWKLREAGKFSGRYTWPCFLNHYEREAMCMYACSPGLLRGKYADSSELIPAGLLLTTLERLSPIKCLSTGVCGTRQEWKAFSNVNLKLECQRALLLCCCYLGSGVWRIPCSLQHLMINPQIVCFSFQRSYKILINSVWWNSLCVKCFKMV